MQLLFYIFTQDHKTPLHHAAVYGHHSIVEYLIKCGADVNAFDKVWYIYVAK